MKRTILSLLVVGLFAGVGTSAIAQNVTAEDQPAAKNEQTMSPEVDSTAKQSGAGSEKDSIARSSQQDSTAKSSEQDSTAKSTEQDSAARSSEKTDAGKTDGAANSTAKADYKTAQDKAQAEYKDAKAKCDSQQGDTKRLCVTQAETARTEALAKAKTQWESQGETSMAPSDTAKDQAADSGAKPADDKVSEAPEQPQYPK